MNDIRGWVAEQRASRQILCPDWWEEFALACAEFHLGASGVRCLKHSMLIQGDPDPCGWRMGDEEHSMSYTWSRALKGTTDLAANHLAKLDVDEQVLALLKSATDLEPWSPHAEVESLYTELYRTGFAYARDGREAESNALDCVGSLLAARFDTSSSLFLQGAYEYAAANKEAAEDLGREDALIHSKNWRLFAMMAIDQVIHADARYDGM